MILLNYALPKHSRSRYTRTFKRVLPRKKTSSMRIGKNHQWNLLEESCQRKFYHFINLDFNNEINDNIENETRERNSKRNEVSQNRIEEMDRHSKTTKHCPSHANILHDNKIPSTNLLTPPATPQVEYEGFQFGMEQTIANQTSELEDEGLPLTPGDSEVFIY